VPSAVGGAAACVDPVGGGGAVVELVPDSVSWFCSRRLARATGQVMVAETLPTWREGDLGGRKGEQRRDSSLKPRRSGEVNLGFTGRTHAKKQAPLRDTQANQMRETRTRERDAVEGKGGGAAQGYRLRTNRLAKDTNAISNSTNKDALLPPYLPSAVCKKLLRTSGPARDRMDREGKSQLEDPEVEPSSIPV
jgi:hypothetical protein